MAFPVHGTVVPADRVVPSAVPSGTVAVLVHEGEYDNIAHSWQTLDAWIAEQGRVPTGDFWEVYSIGPDAGRDPLQWRTMLYRRLKE